MDEFCAHRGVSLWFGRNEESGLRCTYHGWKYDVNGAVRRDPVRTGRAAEQSCRKIKLTELSAGQDRRRPVDVHG